jgi:hypothetical protein
MLYKTASDFESDEFGAAGARILRTAPIED